MGKYIEHVGDGHHPFSKKYEFKGYHDISPCLMATDYKAPKTVLEIHYESSEGIDEKGSDNLTQTKEITSEEPFEGKPFNYVSLFSGIGGFEQALDNLGGTCVLSSEIDKFANKSYEALYGASTAGDITQIEAQDVPDHDVLVGGFPCQAFSVAGKHGGFEDARGTLFFEVARIAAEKQPKMLLLENVKGLVGHDRGRTLDTIVQTLNDIGYTVDFNVLNSKYFGVPQSRERIFIVGVRDDLITPEPWIIEGITVVPKGKRRISAYEGVKTFNFDWPSQGSVTTRLRDILEPEVDEKYYLSDEKTAKLVAQLTEKEEALIADYTAHDGYNGEVYSDGTVTPTLTRNCGYGFRNGVNIIEGLPIREATKQGYTAAAVGDAVGDAVNFQFPESKTRRGRVGKQIANTLEASNINQGVVEPVMLGHIELKGHDAIKRVYSTESVGPTLTTMGGGHREPKIAELQQFSDGSGISYNLDANYTKGTAPGDVGKGRRTHVIEGEKPRYRIRKLTPRECWRLQNFSDVAFDKVKAAGMSDSQMYKQAGNAVTVSVISAIGKKLIPYLGGVSDDKSS